MRTLFCALLLPLLGGALALPAYADGQKGRRDGPAADKDFVARLTAEELELLQKKLPWDKLDQEKKNRIARHVLRLRDMDAKERERFKQRMHKMRNARGERPEAHRGGRRRDHAFMAVFGQAIESMLRQDWPDGLKLADQRKLSHAHLVGSFLRFKLMRRIGEFEVEQVLASGVDIETSLAGLPASKREKLTAAIERARTGDARTRVMLGRLLFHARVHDLRSALRPSDRTPDVHDETNTLDKTGESVTARLAAHVRSRWAAPYQQALDEVRNNTAAFIKRMETPHGGPRGPLRPAEWASLVFKLDDVATRNAKDAPGLAKDADALFQRILRDQLKVPADRIDGLPARGNGARRRAIYKLLAHIRSDAAPQGRGFGRRGGMGRNGRGGRRGAKKKADEDRRGK